MKNKSELSDFYYESLYPILKRLDDDRQQLKYRIIVLIALFSLVYAVLFYIILSITDISSDAFIGLIIIYFALIVFMYKYFIKDYTKDFKDTIIRPLIVALGPKLSYSPNTHVPLLLFNRSEIFSYPDKINGNDFVKGNIDDIPIQFSDLHAQKRIENDDGSSWSTLFRGLFIVAEFNKNFKGKTIILPDTAQSTFGDIIGNWLQSNNLSRDELVKMDNPEFEKEFVVYSSDQIEARYILSPHLMEKLLELKKRSDHPIYFSFVGDHIHIAIYYNKDLFEPTVFKSLLEYKVAMDYVDTMHMTTGIIQELKLNQKIWSKE